MVADYSLTPSVAILYIDSVNRYMGSFIHYICVYINLMSTGWKKLVGTIAKA